MTTITPVQFLAETGAEVVAGRIVIGVQGDRRFIGTTDPTFTLNEEGQDIMAELEQGIMVAAAIADAHAAAKKNTRVKRTAAPGVGAPDAPQADAGAGTASTESAPATEASAAQPSA